ncbi:MAG TPA: hypothetical protein VGM91_22865 [Conexibacter sp.]|jgi:hypothetical protein
MPYDDRPQYPLDRTDDSVPGPDELLDDLSALVDAGLVVPLQGTDGEVRVMPADALDCDDEITIRDQRS